MTLLKNKTIEFITDIQMVQPLAFSIKLLQISIIPIGFDGVLLFSICPTNRINHIPVDTFTVSIITNAIPIIICFEIFVYFK